MNLKDKLIFAGAPIFGAALLVMVAVDWAQKAIADTFGTGHHIALPYMIGIPAVCTAIIVLRNVWDYFVRGKKQFTPSSSFLTSIASKRKNS